jgi:hypothetical protein
MEYEELGYACRGYYSWHVVGGSGNEPEVPEPSTRAVPDSFPFPEDAAGDIIFVEARGA